MVLAFVANAMQGLKTACGAVKELRPFIALAPKHAVLELDIGNARDRGQGLNGRNLPEKAIAGVLNRPWDPTLAQILNDFSQEVVKDVG